jgi:hypothetical protein
MLLVYLDESGIGDAKHEKYVVVAGVIVQSEQYKVVQTRIEQVRDQYVPEKYRNGFVFHAADLFQGSEKVMNKAEFPLTKRRDALEGLISIIGELNLPVVQAFHDREVVRRDRPEFSVQEAVVFTQAIAATSCMLTVEAFARRYAQDSSLALVIYENNDQAKKLVKSMHREMLNKSNVKKLTDPKDIERAENLIPLQRVIDTAHFAEKNEAPILQLADVCAYFIRRRLMGRMDSMRFLNHVMNQLTSNAYSLWPMIEA